MKIKKTKGIVKQLYKELKKVKSYKEQMAALTDEELKAKTVEFRQRFENGESLDKMLPEAFAAMCEADMRVLHMFPFDVQILAGIALVRAVRPVAVNHILSGSGINHMQNRIVVKVQHRML